MQPKSHFSSQNVKAFVCRNTIRRKRLQSMPFATLLHSNTATGDRVTRRCRQFLPRDRTFTPRGIGNMRNLKTNVFAGEMMRAADYGVSRGEVWKQHGCAEIPKNPCREV